MLDSLLGRGYSAKCKSLIKQTKSRIDVIRRKRNATLKFLKKDIADLLANGLDMNAYGRAEGLVAEIMLSSCYDFVEKSCDIVLNHLSVMQKLRECPDDCREAASCLMFAAARFSDLPELRDLRQIFQDRYANDLEYYVNQTFVENLTSEPSSLEKKVQLMKDIAIEFSIEWDFKAFQQRMSNPPAFLKDCKPDVSPAKRHDPPNKDFLSKRGYKDFLPRPEVPRNGCKPLNGSNESVPQRVNYDNTFHGRQEYTTKSKNDEMKVGLSGRESTTAQKEREKILSKKSYTVSSHDEIGVKSAVSKPSTVTINDDRRDAGKVKEKIHEDRDRIPRVNPLHHDHGHDADKLIGKVHQDRTPRLSPVHHDDRHDADKLMGKVHEDRTPGLNPFHNVAVPPPYIRSSSKSKDSVSRANIILSHVNLSIDRESVSKSPSIHRRDAAGTSSEDLGIDHSHKEKQNNGNVRRSRRKHEQIFYNPVATTGFPLPKPRSMRKRHSRTRSGQDAIDSVEESEIVTRSRGRRRDDDSRHGLQILFDGEQHKDEEERMMDKLLIHYSKKPSTTDPAKGKGKAKSRHAHHVGTSAVEPSGDGRKRRDRHDEMSEVVSPPARSKSLPREHSGSSGVTKVYGRAASFQADRSTEARHVHPKLPDYDNLAAQFASLRVG